MGEKDSNPSADVTEQLIYAQKLLVNDTLWNNQRKENARCSVTVLLPLGCMHTHLMGRGSFPST